MRRLPDFLLIGAPKCGTSALHAALSRHPGLFLSTPKEPKFFLTDGPHGVRKVRASSGGFGLADNLPSTAFPTSETATRR